METDERLLKEFLAERKQQISDGGFSRRVMEHLPKVEYVPITRRKWFMVLSAIIVSAVLIAIYLGFARSSMEGINVDCLPVIALESLPILLKTIIRLICETNLPVFVGLMAAGYFFLGREIYLKLKY